MVSKCQIVGIGWNRIARLPLLTTESPVAQWLEHPTRSRRVVGSNPIWGSDFSEPTFLLEYHVVVVVSL